MGSQRNGTMILYASQAEPVWQEIRKNGVAFSKREYVRRKYGESAPVFLTAYNWFVRKLPQYVPKPEGAEFPYWAFADQYTLPGGSTSSRLLTLEVPVEEAVYFDMYDWNKVVQLKYMGKTDADERTFMEELAMRGITTRDVMLTDFYPDLKEQTLDSWKRLFRYHEDAKAGRPTRMGSLQAGLWCIRKEWVVDVR